jgi:predicted ATP-dependent protease
MVIIPAANAQELARLRQVTAHLDVQPVQTLAEAVALAFEG